MKKILILGKRYWVYISLLLIIAIASYLRFLNFPIKYGVDFDPSRDALVVIEGAKSLHFPLIGPKSGIGPFNFGPWYYYELIIFKLLFPFSYSSWIFIGIMSLLFILVMYYIGKSLEGNQFGLLLALLAAFSPEQIGPTAGLSNPNLIPIHAALTILFFIYYLKMRIGRWYMLFLWGLIFGIGINHHYQMLLLFPLPILAFLYRRSKQAIIDAGLFLFGTATSFVPLFVYNLQNHWKTITGFIFFITTARTTTYIPNRWLFYVWDFWVHFLSMLSGQPILYTILLIVFTNVILAFSFYKKRVSIIYIFLLTTFAIDFVFLRYFVVQKELYYFLFFHPLLFIFFGFALWQIKKIKFGWIAIGLLFVLMLPSVWYQDVKRSWTNTDFVSYYQEAQLIEQTFPNKKIAIFGCKQNDLNYPQMVAFFLENDHRLADNGTPVLLLRKPCIKDNFIVHQINFYDFPSLNALSVDPAKIPLIEKIFWKPISPEKVFNETVN
jgi:hypothetical protein